MDLQRKLSQLYQCSTKDYHNIAKNLLTNLRKNDEFLLILLKTFLSLPVSMNSQRFLEVANQIPLRVYIKLLNKAGDKQKFDDNPLIDYQISGIIHLMLRNYSEADISFQKSMEISKNNIHTQFLQSNSARLNFNFKLAETLLKNLLKNDPENAILWDRLGLISLDRHHFSKAEEYFTKSWEKNRHTPHNHSLMQLVWIKIEFNQFEEAQKLLDTAKKNDLNDPYILNSLGDLKRYQKDPLGSINAYTNAIEMNPFEPLFWKTESFL